MLESALENYLVKQCKDKKLFLRKVRWVGRRGAPDRLLNGVFIELKGPNGKLADHQAREIARMRDAGMRVEIISDKDHLDGVIDEVCSKRLSVVDNRPHKK